MTYRESAGNGGQAPPTPCRPVGYACRAGQAGCAAICPHAQAPP